VTSTPTGARFPRPPIIVTEPPRDRSFPEEKFYAALDAEAARLRAPINQAYREAEEEAEELLRKARYARDEALDEINLRLKRVNQRMGQLEEAKKDIRSMQTRRRLEDARRKIGEEPKPKPKKKRKDMRPKLTKAKLKKYRKDNK
jgi:hypothetical protein